jgi:chromosome segregation ATPase
VNGFLIPLAITMVSALPPSAQDTSTQLLQEVRRLREAIETMVSTGARVQIVFGRLQLQEQRTSTAARRLEELRQSLARTTREAAELSTRAAELDERLRNFRGKPEAVENIEAEITQLKRVSTQMEAERARLQNEEAAAAAALAAEQSRWIELNQQLDELDRSLGRRQQ